jgi:hypothetical protein
MGKATSQYITQQTIPGSDSVWMYSGYLDYSKEHEDEGSLKIQSRFRLRGRSDIYNDLLERHT